MTGSHSAIRQATAPAAGDEDAVDLAAAVAAADQPRVIAALAGRELVLPQERAAHAVADPDGEIGRRRFTLPVVERDGGSFVPAFTSLQRCQRALPETSFSIVVEATALAEVWPSPDLTLLVNPGDVATAVALPAPALAALAGAGQPAGRSTP